MNVTIVGHNTLAEAAAHCCARHFSVSRTPSELDDVLWVCYDTPKLPDYRPNVEAVLEYIHKDLQKIGPQTFVLISSQLPVGTTAILEKRYPNVVFGHSPENIRVATPIQDFQNQARIVVGVRNNEYNALLLRLLSPFTPSVVFIDVESAEFVKHALNGFLALQIAYINEISKICAKVGADASKVADVMKMDRRISPNAPLRPGLPYSGGHLEREVYNLNHLSKKYGLTLPLIGNVQSSNEMI